MKDKVVLAFSGGLDTSFCVKYLTNEKQLDVFSVTVNTGGFSENELVEIERKALSLGVVSHKSIDVTQEYYHKCIRYLIYGNILKNNTYPLSVSSERAYQAMAVLNYAKQLNAKFVAHGSTGAGNDQVRFDAVFNILAPEIEIITPIRDLKLSRNAEIEYLKKNGVESDWKKAEYSINKGLWGTSIGGKETLTSNQTIPETAYPSQLIENKSSEIEIGFLCGEPCSISGKEYENKVDLILDLEQIASKYAIGRDMHIGDTIIGIKGRVAFEAAAAILIIKAHHTLEKHTLTKWQQYWKQQLAEWYGMFLHEAQYLEPVMQNIEKFLKETQKNVTGKVIVRLSPYRFQIIGINSEHDLMNSKFAQYGEMNTSFSGEDVKGFTKIMTNQMKIYHKING